MKMDRLELSEIVERILSAPPRPAQAIAAERRAQIDAEPSPQPEPEAEPHAPHGRHWPAAPRQRRPMMGFTPIEVLVVIVVVTVLATIVAPNVLRPVGGAGEGGTRRAESVGAEHFSPR